MRAPVTPEPTTLRQRLGITSIFGLFLAALLGLPVALVMTVREQAKAESLDSARAASELMLQFRRYYNLNIVGRLQRGEHPPVVTENYKSIEGAILIPATTLTRAFTPFYTTRRDLGGSGLGLLSSRRVVEEVLLGSIAVHSTRGVGTSFLIKLPLADAFTSAGTARKP